MEDKPIIISHCTSDIQKKKLTKWDILSRSGLSQYFGVDHGNQFLAVYQAPYVIELWDISSSPVALASLTIPTNMSQEQTSAIDVCQCMVWSHCRDYLFTVFSAQNRPMVSDISSDRKDNSAVFYLWNVSSGMIINSLRCNIFQILCSIPVIADGHLTLFCLFSARVDSFIAPSKSVNNKLISA